jgi:tetratricopeptide (TPR) repeat protein
MILRALCVSVVIPVLAFASPLELPRPNEKWLTLQVDELTFVSNVPAAETSAIARDLLRMRHAIGEVTKLKVRSTTPTRIFIFGSERGFAPYREAIMGRDDESIRGAFTTSDGGNFIVMVRGRNEDADRTVYHELTHYFVRNTVSHLPLWLAEGLADYYSTFRTSGDAVHIGVLIPQHVRWLRQKPMIPLAELFATTAESPLYNEASGSGTFYAQSWALVHYLMDDRTRRAQLGEILRRIDEGQPADLAFTAAFGKSPADFAPELRSYIRRRAFAYTRHVLETATLPEIPAPEPMPRDTLLFELGHLLAHAARASAPAARAFLEEALAENPSLAGAHADIGRLHHMAGALEDANAAFARAAALGSNDPQVHLMIAIATLNQHQGGQPIAPPGESILNARRAFQRSAELDPSSALAWTGIGATYISTDEDPAAGIAALERALTLAPADTNAAFYLVQLYARIGKRAEAQRLIDTVLSRGGQQEQLEFAREVVRLADRNASIRVINDAIAKANAGQVQEAMAILDRLLPQLAGDADILAKVKELRAELTGNR